MELLDANIARYRFECAQLDPEAFQVVSFRGIEEISRPFHFELQLVSKDAVVSFADVVGQPANFVMMRGAEASHIGGMVASLQQAGRSPDYFIYRAQLVPRLWRLSLVHRSRAFLNLTVEEIVQEVMQEAGLQSGADFEFRLQGTLEPREYCIQYQETDLAFVSRLLEFEGIRYFFEHDATKEVVVMTDDAAERPPIVGDDLIRYEPPSGMRRDRETISEASYREHMVPAEVVLANYHDQSPQSVLQAQAGPIEAQEGQHYEYANAFANSSRGSTLATVRKEEIDCQRRTLQGRSDCVGLRCGHAFTMEGYYREELNQDYLLTHVEHVGSQREAMGLAGITERGGAEEPPTYENHFVAIPATVPYRPPRITPVPRVPGLLTGKLETGGGAYPYIDDQGRYRFKNLFDLGTTQPAQASLPARKVQQYSGPDYGIHFPDHADNEVVLAFENGDIDRPIILGSMPNPSNVSPVTSENKTQSVIRTWGQHELSFDDTQGSENIYLHSTKDWTIDITNDKNQVVGNNETLAVGANRDKSVGANQTESVGANKTIQVGGNHSETINGSMTQNVGLAKAENVAAAKSLAVGGAYQVSVGAAMNETVGGAKTEEVGAYRGETVGGNKSESVGGSKTVTVGKSLSISISDSQSLSVAKNIDEKIGGDHHEQVSQEWAVNAKKIQLMAEDQIVLKTGKAEIIMKKSGDIIIKGKKVQVKGSGDVIIKGSNVKQN